MKGSHYYPGVFRGIEIWRGREKQNESGSWRSGIEIWTGTGTGMSEI
jgi:hypothetical protein